MAKPVLFEDFYKLPKDFFTKYLGTGKGKAEIKSKCENGTLLTTKFEKTDSAETAEGTLTIEQDCPIFGAPVRTKIELTSGGKVLVSAIRAVRGVKVEFAPTMYTYGAKPDEVLVKTEARSATGTCVVKLQSGKDKPLLDVGAVRAFGSCCLLGLGGGLELTTDGPRISKPSIAVACLKPDHKVYGVLEASTAGRIGWLSTRRPGWVFGAEVDHDPKRSTPVVARAACEVVLPKQSDALWRARLGSDGVVASGFSFVGGAGIVASLSAEVNALKGNAAKWGLLLNVDL